MSAITLTDRLLRDALAPAPSSTAPAELARVVGALTRERRQVRRGWTLPWQLAPAATVAEARRVRTMRLVLLAGLLALSTSLAVAGAQLLLRPQAPPQVLLLHGGLSYSVPLEGGDQRRPLEVLRGRNLFDFSLSSDGSLLATLRDQRAVLEIWDAPDVLNGHATAPILLPDTVGIHVLDAGTWRPDGTGLLLTASDHGARRVFLVDARTGATTQISPAGVSVLGWAPSPDGRWLVVVGEYQGHRALFLVDVTNRSHRLLVGTEADRIPDGGALGWSPDSATMLFRLDDGLDNGGVWRIDLDGSDLRQVTPRGQSAWWANWSPDGQWIAYETDAGDPVCDGGRDRGAAWLVRPDGNDARAFQDGARVLYWADDSRSVVLEVTEPIADAPLGGVVHAFVDGSAPRLVYAYTDADATGTGCHPYELITKLYRGTARGNR